MNNERAEQQVEQATAGGVVSENLNLNALTKCGFSFNELGLSDSGKLSLPGLTLGEGKCVTLAPNDETAKVPHDGGPKDRFPEESKTKVPRDGGMKDKLPLDSYDSSRQNELVGDKFKKNGEGKGKDNLDDYASEKFSKDKLQNLKDKKAEILGDKDAVGKPEAIGKKPEAMNGMSEAIGKKLEAMMGKPESSGKPEAIGGKPEPLGKPDAVKKPAADINEGQHNADKVVKENGGIKKPVADNNEAQHNADKVVKEDGGIKPWFEKNQELAKNKAEKEAEAIIEKKKSALIKDDFVKKLPDDAGDKQSITFSNPYEESKEASRVKKLLQGAGKY